MQKIYFRSYDLRSVDLDRFWESSVEFVNTSYSGKYRGKRFGEEMDRNNGIGAFSPKYGARWSAMLCLV